jgi:ribosome recycling factor
MNPIKILMLAITFIQLNAGQSVAAKKIIKEAMDVVQSLGGALKDRKITMAEKKALVKELREFTDATIKALDSLIIPE